MSRPLYVIVSHKQVTFSDTAGPYAGLLCAGGRRQHVAHYRVHAVALHPHRLRARPEPLAAQIKKDSNFERLFEPIETSR